MTNTPRKNKQQAADFQPPTHNDDERPFGRGAVPSGERPMTDFDTVKTPAATMSITAVSA